MTIRVEPAYDHFAKAWGVRRVVAQARILNLLSAAEPWGGTDDQREAVLDYLHGLNGRPVTPTRALRVEALR